LTSDTNSLAKDIKLRSVSHRFNLIRYRLDKKFSASRSALTAPNQGLLIHLLKIAFMLILFDARQPFSDCAAVASSECFAT